MPATTPVYRGSLSYDLEPLTQTEARILRLLVENPGRHPITTILEKCLTSSRNSRTAHTHVCHMRDKGYMVTTVFDESRKAFYYVPDKLRRKYLGILDEYYPSSAVPNLVKSNPWTEAPVEYLPIEKSVAGKGLEIRVE